MIPRCRPDSARMCDAPLSLNAVSKLLSSQDLSPVTKAFISGAVVSDLNGIDIIAVLVTDAIRFKMPVSDMYPDELIEQARLHRMPVEMYSGIKPEMRLAPERNNRAMRMIVIENETLASVYKSKALLRCPMV